MSDLVENPDDKFSRNAAQIIIYDIDVMGDSGNNRNINWGGDVFTFSLEGWG